MSRINIPRPNFGYGFDEATADWWCRREIASALDANVNTCLFMGDMMDKFSLHFYSKLIINNITALFKENEEADLFTFMLYEGFFIIEFLYKNQKLPANYLTELVMLYCETNMYAHFTNFEELMEWKPCQVISNQSELDTICDTVLRDNPRSVEDYRKGKVNSINHLKGQIMKLTKGKADVKLVTAILERKLKL